MAREHVRGRIKAGDQIIFDDVELWIEQTETSDSGWIGGCTLPRPAPLTDDTLYQLELDDGRRGDIVIQRIALSSENGPELQFTGTSPLA